MSTIINATTTNGVVIQPDNSGSLVLQSNGTTKFNVDSTGAYGQLQSGTAVASTSGTSIDYTSIPSWVKRITVMLNGVSTNGSSIVQIQLGISTGAVTSGYASGGAYISNASAIVSSSLASGFTTIFASSANVRNGIISIANLSSNTWVASGVINNSSELVISSGSITLSSILDRVRITTVNGTDAFDAGSVNILYE